jgi:pimeloyl-ACP methyl ester carboxylesterase
MKLSNPLRHPFRVPRVEKPCEEGRFNLPNGRRLGFAGYGDPSGAVVLWCHGTPGARRQFPLLGRRAAEKLGLRVVVVERPGSGLSAPRAYAAVADWATDIAHVADALGAERLGVVGLSGGGPYALACGAVPPLAARVAAVAVLGGIVSAVGPEATTGIIDDLARRFEPMLSQLRRPLAALSLGLLAPLIPVSRPAPRREPPRRLCQGRRGFRVRPLIPLSRNDFRRFLTDPISSGCHPSHRTQQAGWRTPGW